MTALHGLVRYGSPYRLGDGPLKPGIAECVCGAIREDTRITKASATAWVNDPTHHQHERSGARDIPTGDTMPETTTNLGAAVLQHDFDHVREEACRVQVRLWAKRAEDLPAIGAAYGIEQSAKNLARTILDGHFTAEQLHLLDEVPATLGKVLASIDPERAR